MQKDQLKVSIFCLAYNHEKYIRETLEGFVRQVTDFDFEVLVHDDASTDQTAQIIREYAQRYPNIIKPTLQTVNQHSQGVRIIKTLLMPTAKGTYFAWCEGDDCWIDVRKLQRQVDFLDAHPDYSACAHSVLCKNLYDGTTRQIPNIQEARDYTVDEVVRGGALFHLSSLMVRREHALDMPPCFQGKGFGDIQRYIHCAICGKFHVLPEVMSQYNHGTPGSWTERISRNKARNIEHNKRLVQMYQRVDEYYEGKYAQSFAYAIHRAQCSIFIESGDLKSARKEPYREFYLIYRKQQRRARLKQAFPFLATIKKAMRREKQPVQGGKHGS